MKPSYCLPCDTSPLYIVRKDDLFIDMDRKRVIRGGGEINLTVKEFKLLCLLYSERGKVFSKAEITLKVWGFDFCTETNTVEVYISFLRNKIDKWYEKKLIQTRPGFGYYLSF